jgi:hypothetical protein
MGGSPAEETLIYIREMGGAPDRWHPAFAVPLGGELYRIARLTTAQTLEFKAGEAVRCEMRTFPDGADARFAIERAEAP